MPESLKITTVGTGKNLVFLHGWGVNSGVWQSLIDLIKNDFCITTIDLPGYGLNHQTLPIAYNLPSVAEMVAENLPENCVLIGWSLGGLVAQQIAFTFPKKIKQLVLVCSSPKFSKSVGWPGIEPKVLQLFIQQLSLDFSKTIERFLAIQAMGSANARQDAKTIKQAVQQYPAPAPVALAAGLTMLQSIDLREQFKSLSTSCFMFLGRLDTLVPDKLAESVQRLNSKVKVEIINNASHAPFISSTAAFAKRLIEILD